MVNPFVTYLGRYVLRRGAHFDIINATSNINCRNGQIDANTVKNGLHLAVIIIIIVTSAAVLLLLLLLLFGISLKL